jgi:predicted CXXCH cytochrome family protein
MVLLAAVAMGPAPASRADTILNTKHDLSVRGPGPIRASTEHEVCAFCHTPHRAVSDTPLWSHAMSQATYTPYSSSTTKAHFGQPTGSSKLCLSCHDGTVALGMLVNRHQPVDMMGVDRMPVGRSNLGTDLSDDHPISFTYDEQLAADNGELKDPTLLDTRVHLDQNHQMQCTSCHSPHDNQYGKFLVMNNDRAALCTACHVQTFWDDSTHRSSTAVWNGNGTDPWPHSERTTVAANGCASCHTPHQAATRPRLLTFSPEEATCFPCHNGNVASKDVEREFEKLSVHPVAGTTGVHDPTEDLVNGSRHVECVDCHNPHATTDATASAPNAGGALAGVTGISKSGAVTHPLQREYELCFRCHADSDNRGSARVTRQVVETNTRTEFSSSGGSYHPVTAPGRNGDVPSLISPWSESSIMYCTDCHNSDEGPGAGGSGPRGPHGSAFEPILERQLELTDFQSESGAAYALCYKCHDRQSIREDRSFPLHHKHVYDKQTACTTCHDPHGVAGQTHLINFNTTYVGPSSGGRLEYIDNGSRQGACYLTCHGKDHNPAVYAP